MLPGIAEPGVELQRQALEDLAAGLAGGGGAPAEQDLGDQGGPGSTEEISNGYTTDLR